MLELGVGAKPAIFFELTWLRPVLKFPDRAGLELLIVIEVRDVLRVDGLLIRVRTTVEIR